jgi:hypothetical protein
LVSCLICLCGRSVCRLASRWRKGHEVAQLAVGDPHQHRDLVIVQPECDGDHVIVEPLVTETDGHPV